MDEVIELEKQLQEATDNLSKLGRQMKASAKAEAELRSNYEDKKNQYLAF